MTSTEPAMTLSTPGSSLVPSELSTERATGTVVMCSLPVMETIDWGFAGCPASIVLRRLFRICPVIR